jgi:hypothetical protein
MFSTVYAEKPTVRFNSLGKFLWNRNRGRNFVRERVFLLVCMQQGKFAKEEPEFIADETGETP